MQLQENAASSMSAATAPAPDWTTRFEAPHCGLVRPIVVSRSGAWTTHAIPQFHGGPALRSCAAGDTLTISADRLPDAALVLLRHSWSGRVEIQLGDEAQIHELYSPFTETLDVAIPASSGDVVSLRNLGRSDEASRGAECWLVGFRLGGTLWPIELGEPVSRTVRLIRGTVGTFLALRGDAGIADALAFGGVWGADEMARFAEHLRPGMTAVDAGANIGHHAVALSKLVGPSGRVIAAEPQRRLHHLLCANLAINDAWNVTALHCALGHESGVIRMHPFDYERGGNIGALGVARDQGGPAATGEEVPLAALDTLARQHLDGSRIDFIKIDVQSFELFVLRGASRVLAEHRPTLQVEISPVWMRRRGYDYREIRWLLEARGYDCTDLVPGRDATAGEYLWDGSTDLEWNMLALPGG